MAHGGAATRMAERRTDSRTILVWAVPLVPNVMAMLCGSRLKSKGTNGFPMYVLPITVAPPSLKSPES